MKSITADPAKELTLYFRINRDGNITFDFGSFDLTGYTVVVNFKTRKDDSANYLQLTSSSGLTVGASTIALAMSKVNAATFREQTYFWEMVRTKNGGEKNWLTGDAVFHYGKFDGLESSSETISINESGVTVNITVNDSGGGLSTVTTDDDTIQGDGSSGSPVAIKKVYTDGVSVTGDGTAGNPLVSSGGGLKAANNLSDVASVIVSRNNLDVAHDRFTTYTKSSSFAPALADWESGTSVKTNPLYIVTSTATITLNRDSIDNVPIGYTADFLIMAGATATFAAGASATVNSSSGGYSVVAAGSEAAVRCSAEKTAANTWFIQVGRASSNYRNIVKLGSNVVNSTTSYADVTGLSFSGGAGTTYYFRFFAVYDSAATTTGSGWAIKLVGGSTPTYLGYFSNYTGGATTIAQNQIRTVADSPGTSTATSGTAGNVAIVEGMITFNTADAVILRFLSEVGGSSITARANMCFVEYIQMA